MQHKPHIIVLEYRREQDLLGLYFPQRRVPKMLGYDLQGNAVFQPHATVFVIMIRNVAEIGPCTRLGWPLRARQVGRKRTGVAWACA